MLVSAFNLLIRLCLLGLLTIFTFFIEHASMLTSALNKVQLWLMENVLRFLPKVLIWCCLSCFRVIIIHLEWNVNVPDFMGKGFTSWWQEYSNKVVRPLPSKQQLHLPAVSGYCSSKATGVNHLGTVTDLYHYSLRLRMALVWRCSLGSCWLSIVSSCVSNKCSWIWYSYTQITTWSKNVICEKCISMF